MIRLAVVTNCLNGYTFPPGKRFDSPLGSVGVVQMSDVGRSHCLDPSLVIHVEQGQAYDKFYLQGGDIVFLGRGNFSATLVPDIDELLIAASPLIIVRPDSKKVLPSYLLWFLNSKFAKQYFERSAQGTTIKAVGIRELAQLELPIPSLEEQDKIVHTHALFQQEQFLVKKIQSLKESVITETLLGVAHQYDQTRKSV